MDDWRLTARIILFQLFAWGAFLLLENQLGPLTMITRRFLAALGLAVLGLQAIVIRLQVSKASSAEGRPAENRSLMDQLAIIGVIASILIVTWCPTQLSLTAVFLVGLTCVFWNLPSEDRVHHSVFVTSICAWVIFENLPSLIPQLYSIFDQIAVRVSFTEGEQPVTLHSWKSIAGPIVSFLLIHSMVVLMHSGTSRWWVSIGGMALGIGFLVFAPQAYFGPKSTITSLAGFSLLAASVVFLWLVVSAVLRGVGRSRGEPQNERVSSGWSRSVRIATTVVVLAVSIALPIFLVGVTHRGPSKTKNLIRVYNRGGLDWHRDSYEKPRNGMFGTLPVVARNNGYQFGVIDSDQVSEADLEDTQVLILLNCPKVWSETERSLIRKFVSEGGSLVVLGDHTDVFGIMNGLNGLLDEYGFEFQFDSAYPAREGWKGCISAAADFRFARRVDRTGVAIGASLKLSKGARPLLMGTYGHSDMGVRENEMGSFLGNYHYDVGEQLGEVVLVGSKNHGYGRVIVYGDTSIFQGALAYDFEELLGPLLDQWLTPASVTEFQWLRVLVGILGLIGLVFIGLTLSYQPMKSLGTWSLVCFVVSTLLVTQIESRASYKKRVTNRSTAIIMDTHINAVGHYDLRLNTIGPLYQHLMRGGFDLAATQDWDSRRISEAGVLIFIAPQKPFSQVEISELLQYQKDGGVVLICSGYEESIAAGRLLHELDLRIVNRPLGTVELRGKDGKKDKLKPRFLDAWAIESTNGESLSNDDSIDLLFSYGGEPCALFKKYGAGGLLLFSDTRFFSSSNVEDQVYGFSWPGNHDFIRGIFSKYLNSTESVDPVFTSPEMPR